MLLVLKLPSLDGKSEIESWLHSSPYHGNGFFQVFLKMAKFSPGAFPVALVSSELVVNYICIHISLMYLGF